MKIRLSNIIINNFKGISHFELNLGGESATVAGRNGTGKTTLADAYYWLFSDQDSIGQANFDIIQLNKTGAPIDNQDATVEAEIFVGSQARRLKKTYRQKWTKKRGSMTAELTGHTTEYFYDGAPLSKTKYNAKLNDMIGGDMFRIISDVHYFCGKTKPDDRRRVLLDITGGVSDLEIMRQDKGLYELPGLLGNLTVEEFRNALTLERRKINEQLKEIPARIDELRQMMPDLDDVDEVVIRDEITAVNEKISQKKHEIIAIESGLKINELKARAAELREEKAGVTDESLFDHQEKLTKINAAITGLELKIQESKEDIEKINNYKSQLADEYRAINRKKYSATEKCSQCGQALPAEFEYAFNAEKATKLKALDEKASELIAKIDAHELNIRRYRLDIIDLNKALDAETAAINKINKEIAAKKALIEKRQAECEAKINALMVDAGPEIKAVESALSELENEKGKLESVLLDFVQLEKIEKRIKVKNESLKSCAKEFELIEKRLNMLDEFSRKKSEIIEKNANAHFEITSWKLFETQINGGLREVCEPMRNGVSYSSTLNTGSRINVGLDCIRTISDHYDMHAPIFVDDAEKITEWVEWEGAQVIKLIAMPNVDKLEVINGG
ncbi:MAG: AAA family ATPase [Desulfobacterales bacterium]